MTIQYVELDDDNVPHVTRHGVTLTEIETLLLTATRFARNKRSGVSDYVAVGNGIRVNFIYDRRTTPPARSALGDCDGPRTA